MTKRILTGIKPTSGQLHLGNYFGAIKPMMDLSKEYADAEMFLFLANMHAFTQLHDPVELKQSSINIIKLYLACGVDPKRFLIYNPASIPGHAQLSWVLTCLTHMGFMERMHAYKDAINKGKAKEVSVGTFCYPILMAADIILYDANYVPVGKDQKQHVEYARDIAQKFNNQFGETFVSPEPLINTHVATIPGIDGQKMSKSYNNYIGLLEEEKPLLKKIKQIATDATPIEEPKDPDACNVYNILKHFLDTEEDSALRKRYTDGGLSYKDLKEYAYEKISAFLQDVQKKYYQISDQEILDLLQSNEKKVSAIAEKKIQAIYQRVGFTLN